MLRLIAIETRLLLRQSSAWAVLIVLLLSCLIAVVNGRSLIVQQQDGRAAFAATSSEAAAKLAKQVDAAKSAEDTVLVPTRISLPVVAPLPLLLDFSAGRSTMEPYTAATGLRTRSDTLFRSEALDNPELQARGSIDLGFVVIVIAPLLLIGLGYGLFAGERDSGAASLILAQAGSPVPMLVARSIPRLALVMLPIGGSVLVLLVFGPDVDGRGAAAAMWVAMAALSLLFWWSVILFVNSFRIGADTAGLALAALWAALVLIAPALLLATAQALNPAPSRFDQIATARAAQVSATTAYENDHPELDDDSLAAQRESLRKGASIASSVEAAVAPLSADFDRRLAAQQSVVRRAQILSPPLVASDALAAIARTDGASFGAFREAAFAYKEDIRRRLSTIVARDAPMTGVDLATLPSFASPTTSPFPVAAFLFLALVTLALGAAAWMRFARIKLA